MNQEGFFLLLDRHLEGYSTDAERQQLINFVSSFQDSEWNETLLGDPIVLRSKIFNNVMNTPVIHAPVRRMNLYWMKYAAVILIIISIAGAYLWINNKSKNIADVTKQDIIAPNKMLASIRLSNGSTINVADAPAGVIATENNIIVEKLEDGRIVYKGTGSNELLYNTITVPRGSKPTNITLADGSIVYLNTETSIKYPVAFVGKERRIELNGEAYFEVAANKQQPFIVETAKDSITVLGTEFNINAYGNEAGIKTTLVEGSVKVNRQVIKPGQGYLNGEIVKTDVDMDLAWRRGIFQFNHSSIPVVLRQVSRWYNLDVVYRSKVPTILFSGKLSKELTVNQIIKVLNDMEVKCELVNGKLIVY